MDFSFSEDQRAFSGAIADLFAKHCPPDSVRLAQDSSDGRVPDLWEKLADMGVVGLAAPEAVGGLGMDELDLVLLLEQMGRACVPGPIVDHAAVAIPTLAEIAPTDETLAAAAEGSVTLAVGLGEWTYVLGASQADYLLLQSGDELHLVDVGSVSLSAVRSVDESRRLASVVWSPSSSTLLSADGAVAQRAFDRGVLASASVCIGVAQQLLDMTVAYVAVREQFGKPVGVNQAVKHHCANMGLAIEFARPLVYQASWALAHRTDHAGRDVSAAKVLASDAADLAARLSLQCHGAVGYTVEYDLQLWLKRAWAVSAAWGSADYHRRRVADSVLGAC
ncbi:MAG: acyl-CoA dehydrogenase family protein [Acidimicrobiales bacterium]